MTSSDGDLEWQLKMAVWVGDLERWLEETTWNDDLKRRFETFRLLKICRWNLVENPVLKWRKVGQKWSKFGQNLDYDWWLKWQEIESKICSKLSFSCRVLIDLNNEKMLLYVFFWSYPRRGNGKSPAFYMVTQTIRGGWGVWYSTKDGSLYEKLQVTFSLWIRTYTHACTHIQSTLMSYNEPTLIRGDKKKWLRSSSHYYQFSNS